VLFQAVSPVLPPLLGRQHPDRHRHSWRHVRLLPSNFRTRVLPVSPNTRTTY
jgi:hypothetical protein